MVLLGFALFIIFLLIIGMPVAFTLSLAGILGIIQFVDMSTLSQVPVIAFKTLDSYVLTSVPLYILMSQIMLTGRVGSGLFDLGSKWMGHLPGGLGIATIFACAIFAAISGSSVATAVTIGAMAIPEMLKRGYDRKLVVGSVAAGGTLGILIPPSIPMILYGTITDESVGKLFMSGVVPGALLTLAFVAYIVFASWNKPREARASHAEKMKSLRENIWGLLLPVIIIGGIYTGIFTPTEAAAVGTVYALIITFFVYRSITIEDMPATQKFVSDFEAAFKGTPNQFAADAYDCVYVIKEAAEKAELTPDMSVSDMSDALKKAMTEIKVDRMTGKSITWREDGEPTKDPTVVIVQGGVYKILHAE